MHPALRYWLFQLPGLVVLAMLLGFALRQDWITPAMAGLAIALWIIKDAVLYIPWARALRKTPVPYGRQALIGRAGRATTRISRQSGYVKVNGETWHARCAHTPIEAGARIRVIAAEGMQLRVERED